MQFLTRSKNLAPPVPSKEPDSRIILRIIFHFQYYLICNNIIKKGYDSYFLFKNKFLYSFKKYRAWYIIYDKIDIYI
jgi:hypothetical protein